MFTVKEREAIRDSLLSRASADGRVSAGAVTGSASVGKEDEWSDIDLAFGVSRGHKVQDIVDGYSAVMREDFQAVDFMDITAGDWHYRVFLLRSTLQVDLAFAPAESFGAGGPTFKLMFGSAGTAKFGPISPETPSRGWAWLYALHVRSAIARGKLLQAENLLSHLREQVLSLACVRLNLRYDHGREFDLLAAQVRPTVLECLPNWLDAAELARAFGASIQMLVNELKNVQLSNADELETTLRDLARFPAP